MNCRSAKIRRLLWLALALGLGGCLPSADRQWDEQKEPFFMAGQRKLSSFDYPGAAEAFEKAIEANPRSASAHFQLGLLYEQKITEENSYAVAVYHYNKFLQLRPKSEYAEIVRQRIIACKQELAKPIALAPNAQSVLRDLERLKVENAQYKSQLEAWAAFASNHPALLMPLSNRVTMEKSPLGQGLAISPLPGPSASSTQSVNPTVTPARALKTYKVQAAETLTSIAHKYGITVKALTDANPGVDAKRLQIGQVINVPAP